MIDILTAFLLVVGAAFAFVAALGIVRMPDIMIRMHASTKAGTLGVGMIVTAVAFQFAEVGVVLRAVAIIAFLVFTAPVAAHAIARAAYHTGVRLWGGTVIDELGRDVPKPAVTETLTSAQMGRRIP